MKNLLFFLCITLAISQSAAQTATNFTCNDCSGTSHDLFSELDAGKVIVLVWVMPCSACQGPALTTYNTVQSFQTTNPNQVYYYMADDYGNSLCSFINSWATGIGVPQNAWSLRFSNAAIDMTDYGATGMPKIVVLGGINHTVFYNANNSVNQAALQNAITTALASTGIQDPTDASKLSVYPNPATETATITYPLATASEVTISLFDLQGNLVAEPFRGSRPAGKNEISLDTSKLPPAMYLVKISDGHQERALNVVVKH